MVYSLSHILQWLVGFPVCEPAGGFSREQVLLCTLCSWASAGEGGESSQDKPVGFKCVAQNHSLSQKGFTIFTEYYTLCPQILDFDWKHYYFLYFFFFTHFETFYAFITKSIIELETKEERSGMKCNKGLRLDLNRGCCASWSAPNA